jgi:hypothetical protein
VRAMLSGSSSPADFVGFQISDWTEGLISCSTPT